MDSDHDQDPGGSDQPAETPPGKADEPVLPIEFYGKAWALGVTPESGPPNTTPRSPSLPPPKAMSTDATAGSPGNTQSQAAYAEQRALEQALAERQAMIATQEAEAAGRESALARREQSLAGSEGLLEAESADLERRERRLALMESTLQARTQELDEREVEVERRESELEAAFSLREDRTEQREAELAELEARLERKEQDMARYVGQIQAEFARRA